MGLYSSRVSFVQDFCFNKVGVLEFGKIGNSILEAVETQSIKGVELCRKKYIRISTIGKWADDELEKFVDMVNVTFVKTSRKKRKKLRC